MIENLPAIGLFLDLIGVTILFIDSKRISDQITPHGILLRGEQPGDNKKDKSRRNASLIGYGLLFLGFALQLAPYLQKLCIYVSSLPTKG